MDHTYHACLLTPPYFRTLWHKGWLRSQGPWTLSQDPQRASGQGPHPWPRWRPSQETKFGINNLVIVAPFQEVNALQGHMAQGPTGPNEQIARHGVGSIGGRVTESPPLATPWG